MSWLAAIIAFIVGLGGVMLGAFLARRNEKQATVDRLLVGALNDLVSAIAEVAQTSDTTALARYGSAASRIALHAPPNVVAAFRDFQDDPTTETLDGKVRLLNALQVARNELGHGKVSDQDMSVLMFGESWSERLPEDP
jgi:hypothetical protein